VGNYTFMEKMGSEDNILLVRIKSKERGGRHEHGG
jgi:hypothetical protein